MMFLLQLCPHMIITEGHMIITEGHMIITALHIITHNKHTTITSMIVKLLIHYLQVLKALNKCLSSRQKPIHVQSDVFLDYSLSLAPPQPLKTHRMTAVHTYCKSSLEKG